MKFTPPAKVAATIIYKSKILDIPVVTEEIVSMMGDGSIDDFVNDIGSLKNEGVMLNIMILGDLNKVKVAMVSKKDPFGAPYFSKDFALWKSEVEKIKEAIKDGFNLEKDFFDNLEIKIESIEFLYPKVV